MELATYASADGYCEAILRGLRSSFLNEVQYGQMKNCSTIGELKTFLEETDYGVFLQAENQDIPIITLREKLRLKLAQEFEYIGAQSVGKLSQFLHLIRCKYMLDNVVNIIEQLRSDPKAKFTGTHPLGHFEGINNIVIEGDDLSLLYRDVLIDTPVGAYFMRFLEDVLEGQESKGENRTLNDVQATFKDMKPEFIRNSLKKMWLEDFYNFCSTELNGTSTEMMVDLLKVEADFKNIQVCYNTIGNKESNTAAKLITVRKQLSPSFGYLYPDCDESIKKTNTIEGLREAVKGIENYKDILKDAPDPTKMEDFSFATKTLEDIMTDDECKRYAIGFDQAAQYTVFYSYLKLKELEIRNIIWLAEMIARSLPKGHPGWKKIIVPFSHFGGK